MADLLSTITNGYAVSRSIRRLHAESPSLRLAYRTTSHQLVLAVRALPEVASVNRLDAVFAGNEEVLVGVDLDLADDLTTNEVERTVDKVKDAVRDTIPAATAVRVDPNSPAVVS